MIERARLGGEEDDRVGEVVGGREAAQRGVLRVVREHGVDGGAALLRLAGEHLVGVGAGHEPGQHDVHPDVSGPTSFASVCIASCNAPFVAAYAPWPSVDRPHRERGHRHDRAATDCAEVRDRGAAQLQWPEHVDLPRALPVGEIRVDDRVVRAALRRAAHHDVEPTALAGRPLDQRPALRDIAGVGGHDERAAAEGLDLRGHLLEVRPVCAPRGATSHPSRARPSAIERPMPGPTPVTTATLIPLLCVKSSAMRSSSLARVDSSSARHPRERRRRPR